MNQTTPKEAVETLLERGWTEAAIAEEVGVTQPTINRIKTGTIPGWDVGRAIVDLAKSRRNAAA